MDVCAAVLVLLVVGSEGVVSHFAVYCNVWVGSRATDLACLLMPL